MRAAARDAATKQAAGKEAAAAAGGGVGLGRGGEGGQVVVCVDGLSVWVCW